MKLTFKLNQVESEGFLKFMEATNLSNMTEEEFVKSLFFLGAKTRQDEIVEGLSKYMKEHPELEVVEGEETETPKLEDNAEVNEN